MPSPPKTWHWILAGLSGIPSWMLILFMLGHMLLKIPLILLLRPLLALVLVHVVAGLTLYWFYSRMTSSSRSGYLWFPIGLYFALGAFVFSHYAGRFGIVSRSEARYVLFIFLVLLVPCLWGASYTLKTLHKSRQGRQDSLSRKG